MSLRTAALACVLLALAGRVGASPAGVVEDFIAAYNRHDAEAMAGLVSPDVAWYGVEGAAVRVDARGREALQEAMSRYFEALPSVGARVEGPFVTGNYVVFREHVRWESGGESRRQSALAVYRVEDGLIREVWYFPADQPE